LPSNLTQIGSYPLALLPGQYQDAYRKYHSDELKYMPINTALYYYPKPRALIQSERFTRHSSDEEDETRPLTPQPPAVTISNGQLSNVSQLNSKICHICKIKPNDHDTDLVTCTNCQHSYHPTCIDVNQDMLTTIKTYSWQCIDCKSCAKCTKTHDEANMMFCDRCDRGYHTYCVGLEAIPDGSWQCSACDSPVKAKRGRPSIASRLSPQSIKTEQPARASSRRSRKLPSTSLSPTSSNSSSADLLTTNSSSSLNLMLTRTNTEIKTKT